MDCLLPAPQSRSKGARRHCHFPRAIPPAERQAVARVVSLLPLTWRSDAKFFLAKNIHLMIIRPLSWRDREEHDLFRLDSHEWSLIESDVKAIVQAAESAAMSRERLCVSYIGCDCARRTCSESGHDLASNLGSEVRTPSKAPDRAISAEVSVKYRKRWWTH